MYLSLYKEIIFGAQSSTVTNKIKQQHWDEIVAAINQQCPSQEPRDREETKKKWNNLASDARKNLKDHKKSLEQTGIIYSFNLRHLQLYMLSLGRGKAVPIKPLNEKIVKMIWGKGSAALPGNSISVSVHQYN